MYMYTYRLIHVSLYYVLSNEYAKKNLKEEEKVFSYRLYVEVTID